MDFFAHGFWSFLIFHRFKWRWWALFFGLLPDLASWFIFTIYNFFTHAVDWGAGRPDLSGVPGWEWALYDVSHSLIVWIALFFILWLIFKRPIWAVTAGMIAIVMDVFTHTREFLPTPFLWPISEWRFPGISWGSRWFMLLNYGLLAIGYSYFFIYIPWKEGKFEKFKKKVKKKKK